MLWSMEKTMTNFLSILKAQTEDELKARGFKFAQDLEPMFLDSTTPDRLVLYPENYFILIPDNTDIVKLNNDVEVFDYNKTNKDSRFGVLAFGFIYD